MTDVIVVGGGPAGLTAGLYLARAGRSVLVLEESTPGGQINFSPLVENYPGLPRVAGSELGDTLAQQAQDLGAQLEYESVTAVTPLEDGFQVDTDCGSHTCKGLILATGVRHRPLGLPG
ncbi:MAG: NAD(P)/FAD-dependent oxidoreductase, partial [Flintibacter sp.]